MATIEQDFHIPINHFVEANFPGFSNVVRALHGVYLDFPDRVKDDNSGLHIKEDRLPARHRWASPGTRAKP